MEWANVQNQRNLTRNEMLIYRFPNKKKLLKIQITSTFSNFTCHAHKRSPTEVTYKQPKPFYSDVHVYATERTGQPSSELAPSILRREADRGVWWESIILT